MCELRYAEYPKEVFSHSDRSIIGYYLMDNTCSNAANVIYFVDKNNNGILDADDYRLDRFFYAHLDGRPDIKVSILVKSPISKDDIKRFGKSAAAYFQLAQDERKKIKDWKVNRGTCNYSDTVTFDPPLTFETKVAAEKDRIADPEKDKTTNPSKCYTIHAWTNDGAAFMWWSQLRNTPHDSFEHIIRYRGRLAARDALMVEYLVRPLKVNDKKRAKTDSDIDQIFMVHIADSTSAKTTETKEKPRAPVAPPKSSKNVIIP